MTPKKAFYNLTEDRQREIIEKTVRLYAENPYEDVTVRAICQELSININTFYRYFQSKDDMYLFLYHNLAARSRVPQETVWKMENFITTHSQNEVFYTPDELRFLENWRTLPDHMLQRLIFNPNINRHGLARNNIERGVADGTMRPDLNIDVASYIFNTVTYLVIRYAKENQIEDPQTIRELKQYVLYDFLNYGLRGCKKPETEADRVKTTEGPLIDT